MKRHPPEGTALLPRFDPFTSYLLREDVLLACRRRKAEPGAAPVHKIIPSNTAPQRGLFLQLLADGVHFLPCLGDKRIEIPAVVCAPAIGLTIENDEWFQRCSSS